MVAIIQTEGARVSYVVSYTFSTKKLALFLALLFFIVPDVAFAGCNGPNYDGRFDSRFKDPAIGMAISDPGNCPLGEGNLIAGTICLVQSFMASAMFEVYCSILNAWTPIIQAAIVLYVMFFSIALTFGISKTTPKQAGIRYIKLAIIYMLATTPDYFYF